MLRADEKPKPNIVLVISDAFNHWVLDDDRVQLPNIRKVMKESYGRVENFFLHFFQIKSCNVLKCSSGPDLIKEPCEIHCQSLFFSTNIHFPASSFPVLITFSINASV
jgi:hypothetical protein